jgi:hypothetical protein
MAANKATTYRDAVRADIRKDLFGGWVSDSQAKLYQWPRTKRLLIDAVRADIWKDLFGEWQQASRVSVTGLL